MQVHEKYHDPVKVWVMFDGSRVLPKAFEWGKSRYTVDRLLHVYSAYEGRERVHYFSVANQENFFRLALYGERLEWFILEHYQD
jgi:hypothetical protein